MTQGNPFPGASYPVFGGASQLPDKQQIAAALDANQAAVDTLLVHGANQLGGQLAQQQVYVDQLARRAKSIAGRPLKQQAGAIDQLRTAGLTAVAGMQELPAQLAQQLTPPAGQIAAAPVLADRAGVNTAAASQCYRVRMADGAIVTVPVGSPPPAGSVSELLGTFPCPAPAAAPPPVPTLIQTAGPATIDKWELWGPVCWQLAGGPPPAGVNAYYIARKANVISPPVPAGTQLHGVEFPTSAAALAAISNDLAFWQPIGQPFTAYNGYWVTQTGKSILCPDLSGGGGPTGQTGQSGGQTSVTTGGGQPSQSPPPPPPPSGTAPPPPPGDQTADCQPLCRQDLLDAIDSLVSRLHWQDHAWLILRAGGEWEVRVPLSGVTAIDSAGQLDALRCLLDTVAGRVAELCPEYVAALDEDQTQPIGDEGGGGANPAPPLDPWSTV